jgi:hypothetical protein
MMCQHMRSLQDPDVAKRQGREGRDEPGDHGRCDEAGDAQRGGYVDVDDGS